MGVISCGVVSKSQFEFSQRTSRRRNLDIFRSKFADCVPMPENETEQKRQKLKRYPSPGSFSRHCENTVEQSCSETDNGKSETQNISVSNQSSIMETQLADSKIYPKFGFASVCGKRENMEDAVAVHPSFSRREDGLHYYGVYDGHGCSHVAMKCRDRLHELVTEELESHGGSTDWERAMERSFFRMDREVSVRDGGVASANCRCALQTPECNHVGSTAVVSIVTPEKIIVANCGDSRAVLSRSDNAVPLSIDQKPDRPDEQNRIEAAGGRVIFWDCPRVEGVLAMSRAIGDDYLKPHVICEPEVKIIDRTAEDNFLILATDGLWDVVSNEMACRVARVCLQREARCSSESRADEKIFDKACSDASKLLTKLALRRHSSDNVSVVVINLKEDTL